MDKQNETAAQLTRFREATRELDSVYAAFPKACGLSEAEYWSLVAVYEGLETQSRISAQLYLSRQTLNSAFRQLRRKGLVQLEPYADNQRSKRAVLTDEGRRFVETNVLRMHRIEERAWAKLTGEERRLLPELTRRFSALVRRELALTSEPDLRQETAAPAS